VIFAHSSWNAVLDGRFITLIIVAHSSWNAVLDGRFITLIIDLIKLIRQ